MKARICWQCAGVLGIVRARLVLVRPQGFFKLWAEAAGLVPGALQGAKMGPAFAQTFVANVLGVIVLAVLMANLGMASWWEGLLFGGLLGLVFRGGAHALHNGFALRSGRVTFIDAAHVNCGGLSGSTHVTL